MVCRCRAVFGEVGVMFGMLLCEVAVSLFAAGEILRKFGEVRKPGNS